VRTAPKRIVRESKNTSRAGTVYARLVAAGQRLIAVIKQNEGLANKDLAKFADQIEALCNKWQR
ncbi:MAG: MBL fold metallo-hydrolase, partial [Oscillospiraceae bacterium]|nr:MBL fold metallo-hydrolase [Oscillospiraceae bacterium]